MNLYYREVSLTFEKENERSPLIFLHGICFSGKTFKIVAPIIAKKTKRKAYILDARNHGRSPWSSEMSYDHLTNDLLEFMQQHDLPKAVLIGNSMGGRTAINFALKYPDKVDALVVEDMTPRDVVYSKRSRVQEALTAVNHILESMPSDTSLKEAKITLYSGVIAAFDTLYVDAEKFGKALDWDIVPIVKAGNTYKLECNVAAVVSMLENNSLVQNLPEEKAVFNGDALFLYGSMGFFKLDKDPSVKKLFPRALIKRIEGSSHFIHLDSPELYSDIISDFLLQGSIPSPKY